MSVSSSVDCGSKKERRVGGKEGDKETERERQREKQGEREMSLGEMQHVRNLKIHSNIDLFSENTQGVASHLKTNK